MSQLHRFYVPDLAQQPAEVTLPDEEVHHALRVVRVRPGQLIQLFDGAGRWSNAEVTEVGRRELGVLRDALHEDVAEASSLTLAQAWLNHEKSIEGIVQRGTELGVDRFIFFRARHSEKAPRGEEKWARWAVESCKQCGRNRLPEFFVTETLAEALAADLDARYVIATQHATHVSLGEAVGDANPVLLLVGPEGDFTPEEVSGVIDRGGQAISLGPRTLRSEVAATVAVALTQQALGRLGPR